MPARMAAASMVMISGCFESGWERTMRIFFFHAEGEKPPRMVMAPRAERPSVTPTWPWELTAPTMQASLDELPGK